MLRSNALLGAAALLIAACAHPAPVPAPPATPPGAAPANDALAPFPYTVEQLRAGCPEGRVLRYRLLDGGKAVLTEMRFVASTAEAATIETTLADESGKPLGPGQRDTTPWSELMKHASFPAATTAVEDAELDTPAGHFAARKYTVRRPFEDQRPSVAIFYFDKARGGPPVRMLVEVGGAIAQEMTLLGDGPAR